MKLDTQEQVNAADSTLRLSWVIVAGAVIFSILTVTPLVQRVTPDRWDWTAPILPLVVDTAVVIVVRVDAIVARLGGRPGGWPALLRWLTGLMTLALNVGDSALRRDLVGVGVHAAAPTLLIVTAEAALKWRQTITTAAARIERERQEAADRERQQAEADRERERRERQEAADRVRREQQEAEDRADRRERERREHEAALAREAREAEAALVHERLDAEERERREQRQAAADERDRQERREAEERRRQEQQQAAERERQETAQRPAPLTRGRQQPDREHQTPRPTPSVSTPPLTTVSTPDTAGESVSTSEKLPEDEALRAVRDGLIEGLSTRAIADRTGWSNGWVAGRAQALRAELDTASA